MTQQGKILTPTFTPEIFSLRFPDNFISEAISKIDTLYSVESKPFYYKINGNEATIIKIDGLGINNLIVQRTQDNFILTTP